MPTRPPKRSVDIAYFLHWYSRNSLKIPVMEKNKVTKRLHVGGLASSVSSDEITERFSRFGRVSNLSLKTKTDESGNHIKTFAHLDLEGDEANIKKCFSTYQNTKWKGTVLQLQYAKESFLTKLEKEREQYAQTEEIAPRNVKSPKTAPSPVLDTVTGPLVPGTPIPGKKNWIVGKYGRVLPVLKLKKSFIVKTITHDPSKFCHSAKVFKDDKTNAVANTSCEKLTWEIDTPDSEITRKRKGEFLESCQPSKKIKQDSVGFMKQKARGKDDSFPSKLSIQDLNSQNKVLGEDLEIVKLGSVDRSKKFPSKEYSNKFDSDIDSDSGIGTGSQDGGEATAVKFKPPPAFNHLKSEKRIGQPVNKSPVKLTLPRQAIFTKTQLNGQLDDQRKIPEFKGLHMLQLPAGDMKMSNKKFGHEKNTVGKSQLEVGTSQNKILHSNSEQVNTSLNKSKLPNIDIKPPGNSPKKFETNSKTVGKLSESPSVIPAFRGLKMLSDLSASSRKDLSLCPANKAPATCSEHDMQEQVTHTTNLPQKKSSLSLCEQSLISGVVKETNKKNTVKKKNKKKRPQSVAEQSSSSTAVDTSLTHKENENYEECDSASSADTDEIIALCKKRQDSTLSSSTPIASTSSSDFSLSRTFKNDLHQGKFKAHSTPNSTFIDRNLSISEFTAGLDSPERNFPTSNSIHVSNDSDSNDSDLDSNDFELVAKKLAQKAVAVGTKGGSRQCNSRDKFNKPSETSIARLVNEKKDIKLETCEKEKLSQSGLQVLANEKSKHVTDNEKRLQAVKERMKQKERQQSLMQKAFQNVDVQNTSSSTRIVFDSSEDEDDEEKEAEDKPTYNSGNNTSSNSNIAGVKKQQKVTEKREGKAKLTLFDNSSEDGDSDYAEMFQSKPHFEGKKGEKLMKLDKKMGDTRFKLDAKFAESDSGDEDEEESLKDFESKSLHEEKAASIRVLENVVGKLTLQRFSEKVKKNTIHITDMNSVRFDPTKMSHQAVTSSQEKRNVQEVRNSSLSHLSQTSLISKMSETGENSKVTEQISKEKNNKKLQKEKSTEQICNGDNSDQTEKTQNAQQLQKEEKLNMHEHGSNKTENAKEEVVGMKKEKLHKAKKEKAGKPEDERAMKEETGKPEDKRAKKEKTGKPVDKKVKKEETGKPEDKRAKKEETRKPEDKRAKKEETRKPEDKKAMIEKTGKPEGKKPQKENAKPSDSSIFGSNSTSKVNFSSSLVDLLKKQKQPGGADDKHQAFSLLRLFDEEDNEKKTDSDNADAQNENGQSDIAAPKGHMMKSGVLLSGLFRKATTDSKLVDKGENKEAFKSDVASSESFRDSDSDGDYSEAGETEPNTMLTLSDSESQEPMEDSEEEELKGMESKSQNTGMDIDEELKNAGRVDIRYTKEQWLQRWQEIRPGIVKMFKRKQREAFKNKKSSDEIRRNKFFFKNSRKGHWIQKMR